MTLDQLKAKLKTDRVARLEYISAAIDFYQKLGVDITEELLKDFDEDAIKAVTGGGGGGTNVIAVF
jgi:hypothetical protein